MFGSKQREQFSIQALQLSDAFLVWLSFWLADEFRPQLRALFGMEDAGKIGLYEISWLLFIVVPFTPLILELLGFYRNMMRKTVAKSVNQMLRCLALIGVIVAVAVVFFQMAPSSRIVLTAAFLISGVLLLIRDAVVRSALRKSARDEGYRERVVIAGAPDEIKELIESMPEEVTDYWEVVKEFDLTAWNLDALEEVLIEHSVHRVIIAARGAVFRQISRTVELCEKQGIEAWVSAGFIRTQVSRPTFDNLGGQPMLVLRATPELSWALLLKGAMDRVGAFFFILCTSPLWLFAMIGIRLASPGAPVFFRQDRAGKYGKTFKMWKFRTMVPDAEAKLAEVKEEVGNEMSGPVFKLENDPRVFPFARFLRKWSIDELPQMLNVLTGDMSLVGPRPLPVYEVKEFEKSEHRRRLSVKPGITCTWQAGGRNTITEWEDWVKMDLEYIDNWSLWLDIKLLLMTVPAVLFGKGAK
ncbi:sugar transferase [Verrucomicrobiaceae bacterium N1E253]|uniref:Sugar transferase n=1 Tax=Oceaniferula marina TaxID=2748318 RepID=A0A851GH64_9BACT|nr:sugar transferase [Oceaniferula marina]NWK55191.1 sugar transferase [Oceaniferula marina]